ncbi:NADPH-dependent 7-cyano-7-deazaguanine reductase [invertebrate metagenome]|uniref:NADPH-dependent 7-cyano-7-deazaguanine reductase n=1 Tax=invertebrate metagenome TaxID=1711999 RepID=A0A2H9T3P4_9ZZZZ
MSSVLDRAPLGKHSAYETRYNPTLLFPLAREEKRKELGIQSAQLPFHGRDLWYGHELSWLSLNGVPQVRVACFEIPCESPYLIESKSFKLYLNSLNQTSFDNEQQVVKALEHDLSEQTGTGVNVTLLTIDELEQRGLNTTPGINIDHQNTTINAYQYDPSLLHRLSLQKSTKTITETVNSHLLKSNCPVTGQPDWGTLVIEYQGEPIDHDALLRYICSFRNHQEFHEQCVERIFMDLFHTYDLTSLTVYAQYLRRGGLDINPWRSSSKQKKPELQRFARQ